MAWIESHESLPSHPKTKRMCRILKITPLVAVGHLHFLWWWAMRHAENGSLDKYSADDIADACSWDGDSELFFNALVEAGFVDRTSLGYTIHDWYDYAGKLIALREKDSERKRKSRGKKEESEGSPPDIPRTSEGSLPESIRDPNPNLNQDLNQDKKDYILTADEILKMINQYKIQCRGAYQVDEIASYIGVIENWMIVEALKRSEFKNIGYVKQIITDMKKNPANYKEAKEGALETRELTGEEWARAAGFGGSLQ